MSIDAICYINLDHRTDRKEHILQEIKKIDPALSKTNRISAEYIPQNGAFGCALSHIKALQFFQDHPEWKTCLLLEDDFTFASDEPLNALSYLLTTLQTYDMILLGCGTSDYHTTNTSHPSIVRILSSQTTSGYIVHRDYIFTLLSNFIQSSNYLRIHGNVHHYNLDQYWKRLMPLGKWYTSSERIGYQCESFSDITMRVENYGC